MCVRMQGAVVDIGIEVVLFNEKDVTKTVTPEQGGSGGGNVHGSEFGRSNESMSIHRKLAERLFH